MIQPTQPSFPGGEARPRAAVLELAGPTIVDEGNGEEPRDGSTGPDPRDGRPTRYQHRKDRHVTEIYAYQICTNRRTAVTSVYRSPVLGITFITIST